MDKKRATVWFWISTVWSVLAIVSMQYAPPWDAAVLFLIAAALSLIAACLYLRRSKAGAR